LAKDEKTNRFVAAKLLHKSFTELELNLLHNEVRALLRLNEYSNRHIQGILDFNFYGEIRFHPNGIAKTAYFIMPVEEHGEFYNIVEKTHGFSESMARIFFRDLLESIEFVHSRNIGHRDIKTENLLLTEDFKLKLCDFGSSCTLMKSGKDDIVTPTEAVGSPEYNAPELHTGEAGTSESAIKAADIFSLGCVLFLMVGIPDLGRQLLAFQSSKSKRSILL
jgi:serine/threonine protein kinase